MLIFISFGIHFWRVLQFFQYVEQLVGSYEKMFLKCRKETNIVCFSDIIGCVYLNKKKSDLWSL